MATEEVPDVDPKPVPLCVDLDGTLVQSDTLWESLFAMIRQRPLDALFLPAWVFSGKAGFKQKVAERIDLDPASLPYNQELVEYLREQASAGRRIVLATAANIAIAKRVSDHLGLFDDIVASDHRRNVSGTRKLEALEELCGKGQFDYAGNADIDRTIWRSSRAAIIVNPDSGLEKKVRNEANVSRVFENRGSKIAAWFQAVRPHQWLKNLLVFLPLLASHRLEMALFLQAAIAFVAFSLCASSAYLINDLLDLPADRVHSKKRFRPLAKGEVEIPGALILAFLLLVGAALLSTMLPILFTFLLACYFAATLLYSIVLKRIVLVDVLALAGLYTLRVLGGGAAVSIMPSFWLLAFSMFLFLSLALVKRGAELEEIKDHSVASIHRGYAHHDLDQLKAMGVASGYMSVLVIALYINSEEVLQNYTRPEALWLICPLLLYWVSRLWLKTGRGQMHHDPLVFAIRDPMSRVLGILILLTLLAAS